MCFFENMTKKNFVRQSLKTRLKTPKTEFFLNFIFFSKYKDEVIFCFKPNLF
jgi:hypothetical protein